MTEEAQQRAAWGDGDGPDSDDPNLYELIISGTDVSKQPQIIKVEGTNPLELIDAARDMSEVKPGGVNPPPREVLAVVNGMPIARFLGRWMWDKVAGCGS